MEIKNLCDPVAKQDMINRVNMLTAASQRKWGKMEVAQMLAHCNAQMAAATGKHNLKGNFIIKLIGPLFKTQLFNEKPYKQGLPTDKSFKITGQRDFEIEKNKLLQLINEYSEETVSKEPHPFFGKLTTEQWSKGTWKHLDHHLQQFGA